MPRQRHPANTGTPRTTAHRRPLAHSAPPPKPNTRPTAAACTARKAPPYTHALMRTSTHVLHAAPAQCTPRRHTAAHHASQTRRTHAAPPEPSTRRHAPQP